MRGAKTVATTLLLGSFLLGSGSPGADERPRLGGIDLHDIYQRLQPGMTVDEVARAADRRALATSTGPVTSWVIWNPPETGRPTTVLRAAFDDGRLVRVEYEAFGDEYRRLIKGGDLALTVSEDELRRLWRRDWRLTQAVEHCEEALEGPRPSRRPGSTRSGCAAPPSGIWARSGGSVRARPARRRGRAASAPRPRRGERCRSAGTQGAASRGRRASGSGRARCRSGRPPSRARARPRSR